MHWLPYDLYNKLFITSCALYSSSLQDTKYVSCMIYDISRITEQPGDPWFKCLFLMLMAKFDSPKEKHVRSLLFIMCAHACIHACMCACECCFTSYSATGILQPCDDGLCVAEFSNGKPVVNNRSTNPCHQAQGHTNSQVTDCYCPVLST